MRYYFIIALEKYKEGATTKRNNSSNKKEQKQVSLSLMRNKYKAKKNKGNEGGRSSKIPD